MIKHVTFLLSLFTFTVSFSQDLIVTFKGDSLNCRIVSISDNRIHYSFMSGDKTIHAIIEQDRVKYFLRNYFSSPPVSDSVEHVISAIPKSRLAIQGGLSRMTARTSNQVPAFLKSYMEKLKTGYHFGIDYSYYFGEWIGAGIRASLFHTKNKMDKIALVYPNGQVRTGQLKDDIYISYIGPAICSRIFSDNLHLPVLIFNLGMGYIGYKNNAVLVDNYTIKSKTYGLTGTVDLDFPSKKADRFSIGLTYTLGLLSYYDITDVKTTTRVNLDARSRENISRIDLSVKYCFYQ